MIKIKMLSVNVLVQLWLTMCVIGVSLHEPLINEIAGSVSVFLCLSHIIGTNVAENKIFNKVFN